MHTVEEAKTKWCPMVKPTSPAASNGGAYRHEDSDYLCIADQCAWWVWDVNYRKLGYCIECGEELRGTGKRTGRCGMVKP